MLPGNQWHCLGLCCHGEIKNPHLLKSIFVFHFSTDHAHSWGWLLHCPALALTFPTIWACGEQVKAPYHKFHCPGHGAGSGRMLRREEDHKDKESGTLCGRQCRTNVGGTSDLCPADGTYDNLDRKWSMEWEQTEIQTLI